MKLLTLTKFVLSMTLLLSISLNAENTVYAKFETPQVTITGNADDPAIWVNEMESNLSIVFGTDKYNGIYSYNLKGEVIGFASAGRINNLDIRTLNDTNYFFGTNTGSNTIDLWIYKNSVLTDAAKAKKFALSDNARYSKKTNFLAYGICAGITAKNEIIAFVTEAKGPRIQLWKFDNDNLKLMSTFNNDNASESEGCVFDDENMTLFVSEENARGIIRSYKLTNEFELKDMFKIDDRQRNIVGDPEGLALYKTSKNDGYLVASSQGNNTFNIYQRNYPYDFISSFVVGDSNLIDGVSDTDGIEIKNNYFNEDFPNGIIVVQDGKNTGNVVKSKENFKYISLDQLQHILDL